MSVYFAQVGRYIKIGFSRDPFGRMTTVTRNGVKPPDVEKGEHATLLGWIPGDAKAEKRMHARFAEARVEGEWFVLDAAKVIDLIWADPRGVDCERMAAQAAFVALARPDLTREQMTACGIQVEATPVEQAFAWMSDRLAETTEQAAS